MTTFAENHKPDLRPSLDLVYEAFRAHGPMTDEQLAEKTEISVRSVSPRRSDLHKLGLVVEVAKATTSAGRTAKVWGLVPPERVEEVRAAVEEKGPRVRDIRKLKLDKKLEIVRQLLEDDEVNDAVLNQKGRAWRRVRGRARDEKGERERQRREFHAQLREAERTGAPLVEFFKVKRNLITAEERVRAVRNLVREELDRREAYEPMQIPMANWPDVKDLLTDLADIANTTVESIRDAMGDLGDEVIEGRAIDLQELYELPEGPGAGQRRRPSRSQERAVEVPDHDHATGPVPDEERGGE
jgi:hypothetical protein